MPPSDERRVTNGSVVDVAIEEEMQSSYIDYSMSVIIGRALPDVRDGLKPVHRRILYGMRDLGLAPNRPYKKSARVVGDVLGKYHPHGDGAVYDAMVRMVQDFSLRYPLIDGQGNFGSVDGDAAAAMRYTEVRLQRLAEELLRDIDKNTVDFQPNFDDSLQEPSVLPTVLPNLLVNGASGIAVGMATNIPPHNLREIVDAITAVIDNPAIEEEEFLRHVEGPDFPTGGIIYGRAGIRDAYTTGRGRIVVRGRARIEESSGGRERIVITEIPYMVNKASMIEKIATLVREKKIEGISDIRDESDRDGLRVVIELKRDTYGEVVLNQLYKHTPLQVTFGAIMLALDDQRPKVMTLRQMVDRFIDFRREVILRRSRFDLEKARKRAHLLEGLKIAVDHIDEVIELIRRSPDPETAHSGLMETFSVSDEQAKGILEMRLQRLTGLEREKIEEELREVYALIEELTEIIENPDRVSELIKEELAAIRDRYGDERRTEIVEASGDFEVEDLIADEDVVVTISHQGYVKRLPVSTYRSQRRGGKGITGMRTKEEDFVEHIFLSSTHSYVLFFSDKGKCYWLKTYQIPQAGRASRGKAIVNLIPTEPGETIRAYVPVRTFSEDKCVFFTTRLGRVKKTPLAAFSRPRRMGIWAIEVLDGDELVSAFLTGSGDHVMLATKDGQAIRFMESDVRPMGRTAAGVRGIQLRGGDEVVGAMVIQEGCYILTVCEFGYGKITEESQYRVQTRNGLGIRNIITSRRNGKVVGTLAVRGDEEAILVSESGIVIRLPISDMRPIGRSTQGVRLMALGEGDRVVDVDVVAPDTENGAKGGDGGEEDGAGGGFGGDGRASEEDGAGEET